MCFFAWRHANGGGATEGRRAVGGDTGQSLMTGGASLLLLEAWPTCHELVWMVVEVCHIGNVAMTRQ
jgi:hypothetical protein